MTNNGNCDKIDDCSVSLCNSCCGIMDFLCIPFHFCLKFVVSPFERPYSFCFIVNFFLLATPILLLLILLKQISSAEESYSKFHFILWFLLINLLTNFAVLFYIYHIYGIHRIEKEKEQTFSDIKLYSKYVYNYFTQTTSLKFVLVYYFAQIIAVIMCLNWINDPELEKKYSGLIVLDFIRFALSCNAVFIFGHTALYIFLFLVLICKINFSCICKALANAVSGLENSLSNKQQTNLPEIEKDDHIFVTKSLRFYKFFGIYDVEKAFPKKDENVIKLENE